MLIEEAVSSSREGLHGILFPYVRNYNGHQGRIDPTADVWRAAY